MKTVLFLFLLASPFSGQTQTPRLIRWETPQVAETGTLSQSGSKTIAFEFANISTQPVVIDNIRTVCGCTVPDWPEIPVAPGGRGRIEIRFEARTRGPFRKLAKVYFHGQQQPEKLYIQGFVE